LSAIELLIIGFVAGVAVMSGVSQWVEFRRWRRQWREQMRELDAWIPSKEELRDIDEALKRGDLSI
jgi:hypothetical protein